jgi:hypothetical protein
VLTIGDDVFGHVPEEEPEEPEEDEYSEPVIPDVIDESDSTAEPELPVLTFVIVGAAVMAVGGAAAFISTKKKK